MKEDCILISLKGHAVGQLAYLPSKRVCTPAYSFCSVMKSSIILQNGDFCNEGIKFYNASIKWNYNPYHAHLQKLVKFTFLKISPIINRYASLY